MLRKFAGQSSLYLLGMVLNRGLAFLLLPLYTRHLTPADYGILAICITASTLLGLVLSLALEGSATVFYFKLEAPEFRKLLRTVWLWMLVIPLVAVGLFELLGPRWLSHLVSEVPWDPYLRLAVWIAYFNIAPLLPLALFRAEQRPAKYTIFTVVSFLLNAGLLLYFVVVRGEGAVGSLRGQLIASVLIAVASHLIVLRRYQLWKMFWAGIKGEYLVSALKLCAPYLPHVFCMWALNLSDRWILGFYVPLSDLGIYSLAYTLGMLVLLFGMALITAYDPIYYQRASEVQFRTQLPRLLAAHFFVITWMALATSLLAPEVLHLMTQPSYYGASALVPWIVMGYWFYVGIYGLSMTILTHFKRTGWTILLTGPPALINFGLNWLLIPYYGILAAAINTLIAFALMAGLALLVSRRLDRLPYPWISLIQMLVVAALTFWVGSTWFTFSHLGAAVLAKGTLLAIIGVLMARIGGFGLTEIWALHKIVRRGKTVAV